MLISHDVENKSTVVYKEDYSDYGWSVVCEDLGVPYPAHTVKSVCITIEVELWISMSL